MQRTQGKFEGAKIVWAIAVLLIMFLVLVPIGFLLYESVTDNAGRLTFENFANQLSRTNVLTALRNTLLVAAGNGIGSVLIGVTLAFGVSRTNMRGKGLVRSSIVVSIMTPPFLLTMAYIILAGPNSGLLNELLRSIFGIESTYGPINIYSVWALVVLSMPQGVATVFLMTFPALQNMDPYLEEASRMMGAGAARTSLRITIPLIRPAILSGLMLSLGQSVALYGVPRMLGINVLTTAIRETLVTMRFKNAAVLSIMVSVLSVLAVFLYRRSIRSSKKFQTISAKGFRPNVMRLRWPRHLFTTLGIIYALVAFLVPYLTLLSTSFLKSSGRGFTFENLTVQNYVQLFNDDQVRRAFFNSVLLAFGSATVVVLLGLIIGYIVVRTHLRGRSVLEYLSNVPMGLSGTALAMGLIFMYLTKPLSFLGVYGTLWILLIAYVTRQIPSGVRYSQSALLQISSELEEASRICGGSWIRTMLNVTIPLAKTGLLYAWILTFISAFPELSASVMLRNAQTDVVATALMDVWDGSGGLPRAAAFGSLVFLLVTVLIMLAQRLTGRSLIDKSSNQ